MTKKREPTPELGIPKPSRQFFTKSESALLDQITLEITEAWAKDLKTIRECHKKTQSAVCEFKAFNDLLEDRFDKLNKMLEDDEFIPKINDVIEKQKILFSFMEEIRQSCFKTQEQVIGLRDLINNSIESLKIKPKPGKWWQIWK